MAKAAAPAAPAAPWWPYRQRAPRWSDQPQSGKVKRLVSYRPPFYPRRQIGTRAALPANRISATICAAPIRAALKLPEFFNFATEQPRLNRRQMLSFYAFIGKLHTLSKTVAVG